MFETVLWATDGSELSDGALPIARDLAHAHGARLVVVHVNALLVGRGVPGPLLVDEREIEEKVRAQVQALRDEGLETVLRIEPAPTGSVAHAIARAARLFDADLVVVATHGYGALGTFFAGSVARGLVRESPCALLVVPPPVRETVAV